MRNTSESKLSVALTKCFFCGENDKIVLNTRLTERMARRVDAMNGCVIDMEPCKKCAEWMKQGVIMITIDSAKSEAGWNNPPAEKIPWMPNPYRTGGFFVVRDQAVKRMITDEGLRNHAIKHRWMFIEHEAAVVLGLFAQTS